eukprot:1159724-Pelagomonas_calceolata.AAC.4
MLFCLPPPSGSCAASKARSIEFCLLPTNLMSNGTSRAASRRDPQLCDAFGFMRLQAAALQPRHPQVLSLTASLEDRAGIYMCLLSCKLESLASAACMFRLSHLNIKRVAGEAQGANCAQTLLGCASKKGKGRASHAKRVAGEAKGANCIRELRVAFANCELLLRIASCMHVQDGCASKVGERKGIRYIVRTGAVMFHALM